MSANATPRVVVDYGPDPADRFAGGVLRDVLARVQGFLVPAVVGGDTDPSNVFYGYGPELQSFKGAGNRASTTVVYRDGGSPQLSSGIVEGPEGDPARRIFAARLRRGQAL